MADQTPTSPPSPPESPVCTRSTQWAVCALVGVALLLIGWRWVGDRMGARPTQLDQDSTATHRVDINKANRTELMQLPGIGPSRADKILSYRNAKCGFQNVDDLRGVEGIGDATLARIRPWLTVDAAESEETSANQEPELLSRKPEKGVAAAKSGKKPGVDGLIDVNRASLTDLQRLPGIGPALAQRIVDERERKPFAKAEDLRRVSGIGAKRLDQIKPYVALESKKDE
jgi:competence protein ComEA